MKKKFKLVLFLSIGFLVVLSFFNNKGTSLDLKTLEESNKSKDMLFVSDDKKIDVLKDRKQYVYKNRQIASSSKINNPNDVKISNTFNSAWKDQFKLNLEKSFGEEKVDINIKHIKSLVYVKYNSGLLAEKIKVNLKRSNGDTSSYMALVNSETGSIINTWDRTRYEFKKRLILDGKGAEFE